MTLGVPGRIVSTFGTTRVVGRQPKAPAAFNPREIPGTHFQRLIDLRAHGFVGRNHGKNPSDTNGNRSRDRPTSSAAP